MQSSPKAPETTPNWAAGFRRRIPFYILTAILLALLAGALTYVYLDRLRAEAVPTGTAVVAKQDIDAGSLLTESMIEVRQVPEAILPSGRLIDRSQAVGRVVLYPLQANEVVLANKLTGGAGAGLSGRLPDGRWAMVLPGGWMVSPVPELTPGDRLDLVAYQAGKPVEEAGVIVSAVQILQFQGSPEQVKNLTLAVTLEEAIAILYARTNGFTLLALLRPSGG